jgi:hypothetical protein
MGDDSQELSEAKDRYAPGLGSFGERAESGARRAVVWQLRAVSGDQRVGIDGDQSRPSMKS